MTPKIGKTVIQLGLGMICAAGINLAAVAGPSTTQGIEISAKEREAIQQSMKVFAESQGASDLYSGFVQGEPEATATLLELGENPVKDRPSFNELPQELQKALKGMDPSVMYAYVRQRALDAAAHPDAPDLAYSLAARMAVDTKGGLEPDYQAAYRYAVKAREAGLPIDDAFFKEVAQKSGAVDNK